MSVRVVASEAFLANVVQDRLTITFTILVLLIEQLRAEHLKAYFSKQTSRLMSILIDDD